MSEGARRRGAAARATEDDEFDFLDDLTAGPAGGYGQAEGPGQNAWAGPEPPLVDAAEGSPEGSPAGAAGRARGGEARGAGVYPAPRRSLRPRKRRSDAGTGRNTNPQRYGQISARVAHEVKAGFDVARSREKAERGVGRDQGEVIETLMRFYAEHGDPYELLQG